MIRLLLRLLCLPLFCLLPCVVGCSQTMVLRVFDDDNQAILEEKIHHWSGSTQPSKTERAEGHRLEVALSDPAITYEFPFAPAVPPPVVEKQEISVTVSDTDGELIARLLEGEPLRDLVEPPVPASHYDVAIRVGSTTHHLRISPPPSLPLFAPAHFDSKPPIPLRLFVVAESNDTSWKSAIDVVAPHVGNHLFEVAHFVPREACEALLNFRRETTSDDRAALADLPASQADAVCFLQIATDPEAPARLRAQLFDYRLSSDPARRGYSRPLILEEFVELDPESSPVDALVRGFRSLARALHSSERLRLYADGVEKSRSPTGIDAPLDPGLALMLGHARTGDTKEGLEKDELSSLLFPLPSPPSPGSETPASARPGEAGPVPATGSDPKDGPAEDGSVPDDPRPGTESDAGSGSPDDDEDTDRDD